MNTDTELLIQRSQLCSKYIGAELKGAIRARGYTQGAVADAIGRPRPTMTNWLNSKPAIPVAEAVQICDFIGIKLEDIIHRAQQRVEDELGPWPPIQDDDFADVLARANRGDITLAANNNPDKEREMETPDE
ncbi:helix-turn-helix domain-containing protein [Bifidobacterium bombi]|uniref:DNA-binding helix-turn-helix domain n=1 Tax=Bifidobacterium bombi DSM 19703 TaxID=1341695 RepID=A0A080N3F8_9BIFI|nr:helix-turn-helix transcriptional regulator [Bifidobacterium bombi]KFF31682.1 DNA-binding helix-turn-helix domain [Bifidobacterium bombi DSM 19703]